MGQSRGHSHQTPPHAYSAGISSYKRKINQDEFEPEQGTGWKDPYTSRYGGSGGGNTYNSSVTAAVLPTFGANSSEDHLRGLEAHRKHGGIWKSMSVAVSHGEV
jgi:hypothetical protein